MHSLTMLFREETGESDAVFWPLEESVCICEFFLKFGISGANNVTSGTPGATLPKPR